MGDDPKPPGGIHGANFSCLVPVLTFPVRFSEWALEILKNASICRSWDRHPPAFQFNTLPRPASFRKFRLTMASNTFETDVVRPAEGFPRPSHDIDVEKRAVHSHEMASDAESKSIESDNFQNGVQRVRAITEIWSKKTLITMFILLVAPSPNQRLNTDRLLACTLSSLLLSYKMPLTQRSTLTSPRLLEVMAC